MRNEVVLALIATPSFSAAFIPNKPRRGWVQQNVAVDPFSIVESVSTEAGSFFDPQQQQRQQPRKGFLESIIETNNRVFEKESNWLGSIFTVDRIGVVETAADDTTVDALASEGDWTAYFDREGTALVYYFNSKTGESRWTAPTKTFPEVNLNPAMRKLARDKRQEYIKATKLVEAQAKENGILSALLAPFEGTKEKVEPSAGPVVEEKPIEIVKTDWLSFLTQDTQRTTTKSEKAKKEVTTETPKALATQGDWSAYLDKSSGFVYFFNAKSGESRWDPPTRNFPKMKLTSSMKLITSAPKKSKDPKPLAEEGDWQAFFDGKENAVVFYYNTKTGESRWDPPTKTFPQIKMTSSMRDRILDKRGWQMPMPTDAIVPKNNKNLLDSIVEFIDTFGKSFQDQLMKNDVGNFFGSLMKEQQKVAAEKAPEKKDVFWFGLFGNQVKPLSAGEPAAGQGAGVSALALERPKLNLFELLFNFKPEIVVQAVVESLESNPLLQLPLSFLHQHDTGATRVIRRGPAHTKKKKKTSSTENLKK